MKSIQFPRKFGEQWIKELRNTEHEKCTGYLIQTNPHNNEVKYCAMGILGKIINAEMEETDTTLTDCINVNTKLEDALLSLIRFEDKPMLFEAVIHKLNDKYDFSFKAIADWLEENLELVDVDENNSLDDKRPLQI